MTTPRISKADRPYEESECWLCGANVNRICWCHDHEPPEGRGVCKCPD